MDRVWMLDSALTGWAVSVGAVELAKSFGVSGHPKILAAFATVSARFVTLFDNLTQFSGEALGG